LSCSGYESEDLTNDEMPDQRRRGSAGGPGVTGGRRSGSQRALIDGAATGDVSDDLYSEIGSRDTEKLLKSRVASKARRAVIGMSCHVT